MAQSRFLIVLDHNACDKIADPINCHFTGLWDCQSRTQKSKNYLWGKSTCVGRMTCVWYFLSWHLVLAKWVTTLSGINHLHLYPLPKNSDNGYVNGYVNFNCNTVRHVVWCDTEETEECDETILLHCGEEKPAEQPKYCDFYNQDRMGKENCDVLQWFFCQA